MSDVLTGLPLLQALEEHHGQAMAAAVFTTWWVAQHHGCEAARVRLPRTTWYRHLRVLASVGCSLPEEGLPAGSPMACTIDPVSLLADERDALIAAWERILAEIDQSPPEDVQRIRPHATAVLCALRRPRLDHLELIRLGICTPDHTVRCSA